MRLYRQICDYSIVATKTRPAVIGEKLVTFTFGLGTTGFVSVNDPVQISTNPNKTAICLLPGTELSFETGVAFKGPLFNQHSFIQSQHQTAIFRQVDKDKPHQHHDVLEFPNGTTVFLTQLCERQTATVLQLPAAPKNEAEAEEQRRAEFVG